MQALRKRDTELAEQEPQGRSERRHLEDEIDAIHIQLQERKVRRREVIDEICLCLLPPDSNLDDFENIETINMPQEEEIPANMRVALDHVYRDDPGALDRWSRISMDCPCGHR